VLFTGNNVENIFYLNSVFPFRHSGTGRNPGGFLFNASSSLPRVVSLSNHGLRRSDNILVIFLWDTTPMVVLAPGRENRFGSTKW
jgi:hypothetical protein